MILISPYSRQLRNGKPNPKNYPWWPELVRWLDDDVTQIGVTGEAQIAGTNRLVLNAPFHELRLLVAQASLWLAVDNWMGHFVNAECAKKPGVVLWGQSDPAVFSYPQNLNILKDRKYLRKFQFDMWEAATYDAEAFVKPQAVMEAYAAWIQTLLVTPRPDWIYDAHFDM